MKMKLTLVVAVFPFFGFFCDSEAVAPNPPPPAPDASAEPDASPAEPDATPVEPDSGIADAGHAPDAGGRARVFFISPSHGQQIARSTLFTMGTENFELVSVTEPGGPGTGHLHIFIDTPCVGPGVVIQENESTRDLMEGQNVELLQLTPGSHSLCLQAGDSDHVALPLTDLITVIVR